MEKPEILVVDCCMWVGSSHCTQTLRMVSSQDLKVDVALMDILWRMPVVGLN